MAQHVCPWWVGYLLANPIRRMMQDPEELLRPYLWSGMTVLEPGPGMGFFTIPVAQMIGETGARDRGRYSAENARGIATACQEGEELLRASSRAVRTLTR